MIGVKIFLSLGIILLSCELFTNAIEWFGKRMKVGDGVVGSIFSAIGTCLPETMIPLIAILFLGGAKNRVDIGIGAIIGAPFMLSTLAFFVTGLSVLVFWKSRKTGMKMKVDTEILSRDISFFLLAYTIGIMTSFIPQQFIRNLIAFSLIAFYGVYIFLTIKRDTASVHELDSLYFVRILPGKNTRLRFILIQLLISLLGIIYGAHLFIFNIEGLSSKIGISALVLSLIITPIATELPEKFNSVLWIRKKKDTLSMGNITGAMVFQSCIPVSIGILSTSWVLDSRAILSAALAIISGMVTYLWMKIRRELTPIPLIIGGGVYILFILLVLG